MWGVKVPHYHQLILPSRASGLPEEVFEFLLGIAWGAVDVKKEYTWLRTAIGE